MLYIIWGEMLLILIAWATITVLFCQLIYRDIIGIADQEYAPFVPITNEALGLLEHIVVPQKESTIYDLGCGDGRVLCAIASTFPQAVCVGIEYSWLPYLLAKIKTRNDKNITIKYKNFFEEDLSAADIVITYLFPRLMDSVLPKLEKELKMGATLYSFDFPFSKKEPESIIENQNSAASRGKRLFIYRF